MIQQLTTRGDILSGTALRLLGLVSLTALMMALGWAAWVYDLERACALKQWPELPSCTAGVNDATKQIERLRERIARNPGDSEASIQIALLSSQPGNASSATYYAALDIATRLAAQDYRVQRMQAARAIHFKQWPQAVDWLVRLIQDNGDGPAALALAELIREPEALTAMQLHIRSGANWLEPLIAAMPQARVPVVLAMPLVVYALTLKAVSPELTQRLMAQLKSEGQWLEAHALWTAWLGHPADMLFNGTFDQGFIAGGFDWEVMPGPSLNAGALVQQVPIDQRGGVLQVEFTGRPIAVPVVRQTLVLLHNRFVFSGQYMAAKLRVNEGLAWVLQCVSNGREIARTTALNDTAGQWVTFTVELDVPSGCGLAVALQLQTFAPYEAVTGLRGLAAFDNFKLETRP